MKNRLRHLCIIVIGGAMILFGFSGCSESAPVTPPQGMTPVETVQFYFEQWNNKSASGMNSVLRNEMRNSGVISALVYVKLTECIDATEKYKNMVSERYNEAFPGYIEYAVVEVEFEIEFKESFFHDAGGFEDGKSVVSNWSYILGKTDEESDWLILDWGVQL